MALLSRYLTSLTGNAGLVLEETISRMQYCPLDLSASNSELQNVPIHVAKECQKYIDTVLAKGEAVVAYGGYLEKRALYDDKSGFTTGEAPRNIHLGLDFWTKAGTKVLAPIDGTVHSFQNNKAQGDYGPTIILKHSYSTGFFHTLYGHLSEASLENLQEGMSIGKGEVIGTLGTPEINVGYAPHLHFQIIEDMEGMMGDYPGVCSGNALAYYRKNCPDPNLLFGL